MVNIREKERKGRYSERASVDQCDNSSRMVCTLLMDQYPNLESTNDF